MALPVNAPIQMTGQISVGIVEDDREIRETLQQYFEGQSDFTFSGGYDSVEKLLNTLRTNPPPTVLIMDLGLPGMSGIDGIKILKEHYPVMDIIVFSIYNDANKIFMSLCAGATGYLLKNTPLTEIKDGIKSLA